MRNVIDGVNQVLEHKEAMARLDGQRVRKAVLKRVVGCFAVIVAVVLLYSACHDEVIGRLIWWTITGQEIE